jgi:glycosyltransferase involved in cell wall biosynthesis
MRIAQVSPLFESVPPKNYGGTERIVSYLTKELVDQGHDVTLFGSGDSQTNARLISLCPRSLRSDPSVTDSLPYHFALLEEVFRRTRDFDVIHFHFDGLHFPLSRRERHPQVTTLHGRLDLPDFRPLYREYQELPVISISNAQRQPFPRLNWQGTVYHGLPIGLFSLRETPGDYLAFLGRVSREKRLDRAIEIAKRSGMKLKVAAKVDKKDQDYFQAEVEPKLQGSGVEFLGEIGGKDKAEFLSHAYALLFPIDWPEPFGLVMIEAMACGTPVLAWPNGSVPEIIENGVTGFIVDTIEAAVAALHHAQDFDRKRCREVFEKRFTAARMARDYLTIYKRLIEGEAGPKTGRRKAERLSHKEACP